MPHTTSTSKLRKRLIAGICCSLGLGLITIKSAETLDINSVSDGKTLIDTIFDNIPGINVDLSSISFTGATGSSGTFTGGRDSGIDIESGIILTTGQAQNAVGPNISDSTGTVNIKPSEGIDQSRLQFDFEYRGGDLSLGYVFASDEYNEFDNASSSDLLRIFLNGENIALIPGTNIPVSVKTVNDGNLLPGDDYSQFYNNNDPSDGGPFFDLEYDGFTDVFAAQFPNLTPGNTYTLEIAIADGGGDNSIDSAVFIAPVNPSISDNSNPSTTVPEPTSILSLVGIVLLGSTTLNKIKNKI